MFTDMVGYTALGQRNESLSLALVEGQRKLIRPILSLHNGREVKTMGDAFLVEFPSALDAVRCAYEIQRAVREANVTLPSESKIHLRIGIHSGDIVEDQGDIQGDAVNVASRIEPLAEDGGVCATRPVYESTRNKISVSFAKMGTRPLKNVDELIEVYRMVMPWDEGTIEATLESDSKRIAVLPFVSMSPDPNDEYFADGLTEELIDRLCQVKELAVISRTSVMNYKNKEKNASQIGKELRVGAIVEGSVRKAGSMIRVTAQLIDASTEEHMWSSRYDRSLQDIFAVQTDIAENVTSALKIRLLEDDMKRISRVPTKDPEAHELYIKGRSYAAETEEDMRAAIGNYEKAIRIDSRYIDAYRALAGVYEAMALHEVIPSKDACPRIREYVNKSLDLDSSSAESHLARALLFRIELDRDGEQKEVRMAVAISPSLAEARRNLALLYTKNRQFQEAHAEIEKALDLDPLSVYGMVFMGTMYLYSGNPEKALGLFQKVLAINPRNQLVIANIGLCHVRMGMLDEGVGEVKRAIELGSMHPNAMADIPYVLAQAGRMEEAREVVNSMVKFYEETGTGMTSVARGYAAIGEKDRALDLLEKAYDDRSLLLEWAAVDFNLEGLHSDLRFLAFLGKLGLPTSYARVT